MSDQQKERTPVQEMVPVQGTQNDEVSIDLMELVYHLIASWRLLVCFALVFAVLAGVYVSYFVTPMYQASSTIYVLSRSDSAINMADLQIGSALTSDYIKVFDMWEVHAEVIDKLELPYTYSQMRGMLSVHNASDTRMLDITITNSDPELTASIANTYAEVVSQYIADTMSTDKPNIMSVALVPANPVSPNKTRTVALAFILGGVLAAGIVVIRMLVDDKYKTADDIRKYTGMVTLAIVPVEDSIEKDKSSRRDA